MLTINTTRFSLILEPSSGALHTTDHVMCHWLVVMSVTTYLAHDETQDHLLIF